MIFKSHARQSNTIPGIFEPNNRVGTTSLSIAEHTSQFSPPFNRTTSAKPSTRTAVFERKLPPQAELKSCGSCSRGKKQFPCFQASLVTGNRILACFAGRAFTMPTRGEAGDVIHTYRLTCTYTFRHELTRLRLVSSRLGLLFLLLLLPIDQGTTVILLPALITSNSPSPTSSIEVTMHSHSPDHRTTQPSPNGSSG
jgi:hypothetical protein